MKKQLLAGLTFLSGLGLATPALAQTPVFVRWPFTVGSTDSAALRSANTTVNPVALRRFVVADGANTATINSSPVTVKPYSSTFGMAFAPLAAGGGWSATAPSTGPGGSLKRPIAAQFSVTAPAGGAGLRADSLIVTTGFLGTSSSTNLGVVYSKTGYPPAPGTGGDSTDVTGNKGPGGVIATTGGFTTPIALAQLSALPNPNTYRIALNGSTGVILTAGQTLTIRVYFSCSSTGATGRYATLRNVILKSQQVVLASRSVASTNLGVYPNPALDQLTVPHASASREAQVLVYSATGAKVATQVAQPGTTETSVSLDALARGLYLVEYRDGDQRSTARIVKQ